MDQILFRGSFHDWHTHNTNYKREKSDEKKMIILNSSCRDEIENDGNDQNEKIVVTLSEVYIIPFCKTCSECLINAMFVFCLLTSRIFFLPMPGFDMISKVLLASCLVATFITFKSKVLVLIFNMPPQQFWRPSFKIAKVAAKCDTFMYKTFVGR